MKSITVPNNLTYFNDTNYTGPIWNVYEGFNIDPDEHQVSYPCNKSRNFPNITETPPHPYVDFKVHINGVSYMIDSDDNLIRPQSLFSPNGFCNIGIVSTSSQINTAPQSILGLPFLRSVYLYVERSSHDSLLMPNREILQGLPLSNRLVSRVLWICLPQRCKPNTRRDLSEPHVHPNTKFSMPRFHRADLDANCSTTSSA